MKRIGCRSALNFLRRPLSLGLWISSAAFAGPSFDGPKTFWNGATSSLWSDENNWACSYAPCIPNNSLLTAILPSLPNPSGPLVTWNDLTVDVLRNLQLWGSSYRLTGNALTLDGLLINQSARDNRFQLPVHFQHDALLDVFPAAEVRFEQPVSLGADASGPLFIQSQGVADFAGAIGGPGGLILQPKPGVSVNAANYQPGRTRLLARNGFTGRIEVEEGFLQLAESGMLGDLTRETVIGPRGQLELARPGIVSAETLLLSGEGPTHNGTPVSGRGALHAFGASHVLTGPIRLQADAGILVGEAAILSLSNTVTADARSFRLSKRGTGTLELAGNVTNVTTPFHLAEGIVRLATNANPQRPRFTQPVQVGGDSTPATLNLAGVGAGPSDFLPAGAPVQVSAQGSVLLGRWTEGIHPLTLDGGLIGGDAGAVLEMDDTVSIGGTETSVVAVAARTQPSGTTLVSVPDAVAPAVDFTGTLSGGPLILDGPTVELRGSGQNSHTATLLRSGLLRLNKSGGAQPHHRTAGAELIVGLEDPDAPLAIARCQDTNQFHPNDASVTVNASGLLILRDAQGLAALTLKGGVVSNGFLRLNGPLTVPDHPRASRVETEELQLADAGVSVVCALNPQIPVALELRTALTGGTLTKEGPGVLHLTGPGTHLSNSVAAGVLRVDGNHSPVPTRVRPGARLAGSGSLGPVWLAATAGIELGNLDRSSATLTVGSLDLARSNTLAGLTSTAGTDRLRVNGTVTLGNDCRLRWGFSRRPALNERIVILQNDGTDPIVGRFANAPEGGSYTNQTLAFRVLYDGGTGNDLALEFIGDAAATTNRPPSLGALPNRNAAEGELLAFTVPASDPDPGQTLQFTAVSPLPPGATLHPSTGAFSWTPGERQGGRTFELRLRVTDDALPSQSDERSFEVTVAERNRVPELPDPGPLEVLQGETLSLLLGATDPDLPAQTLTYTLLAGAPAGMTLNASTGRLRWVPDFNLPSSTNGVTVRVQDNQTPPGTQERTFQVIYRALNRPPVPAVVANLTRVESGGFDFNLSATDPETASHLLTWEFTSPMPPWFQLSSSGQFVFLEAEEAGPATNTVSVRVRDNGSPQRSTVTTFVVVITEQNRSPDLSYSSLPVLQPGNSLSQLPVVLADADLPRQPLTLRLLDGAPSGLTLNPTTGLLTWTVPEGHPATTYRFGVVATDDPGPGIAPLSRTNQVQLTTLAGTTPPTRPSLQITLRTPTEAELRWTSVVGTTYRIQQRAKVDSGAWSLVEEVVAATTQTQRTVPIAEGPQFFRLLLP